MKKLSRLLSVVAALLVFAGCGPERPETIRVRGKVTFDGGPPPKEGMIYFAPIEVAPGQTRRPGRSQFGADGRFDLTSFSSGDGLVPGTYRVQIECWKKPPSMGSPGGNESYVATSYKPEVVTIAPDAADAELTIDVPLAR